MGSGGGSTHSAKQQTNLIERPMCWGGGRGEQSAEGERPCAAGSSTHEKRHALGMHCKHLKSAQSATNQLNLDPFACFEAKPKGNLRFRAILIHAVGEMSGLNIYTVARQ